MGDKIFGLIGRTLKHSFSAPIHCMLGCGDYRLYELEPEQLGGFLQNPDVAGMNVTIPYKRDVMAFCHELSPEAAAIGAVNTVVRRGDRLVGYNTDIDGFQYMAAQAGIDFSGRKVVIFGTGGASLTAQAAAKRLGAKSVVVISRTGENSYENLSRHYDGEILVNATPLGTYPNTGAYPADPGLFLGCKGVLDVVYNPRRTAFLLLAEKAGLPFSDGLPMLVSQAKKTEELFFNKTIPDEEIQKIIHRLRIDTQNIVLIGMPGCGKSTVGAALSRLTGREAVDMDGEIEKSEAMTIPRIFAEKGEAYFREAERRLAARLGIESGKIIMTGGGVVKDESNYASLHQNGRIYHVIRDVSALDREGRPLSRNADLELMYRERLPMYTAFRDGLADNNGSPEAAADEIWRDFCENIGD